jgi:hypothetical protein
VARALPGAVGGVDGRGSKFEDFSGEKWRRGLLSRGQGYVIQIVDFVLLKLCESCGKILNSSCLTYQLQSNVMCIIDT